MRTTGSCVDMCMRTSIVQCVCVWLGDANLSGHPFDSRVRHDHGDGFVDLLCVTGFCRCSCKQHCALRIILDLQDVSFTYCGQSPVRLSHGSDHRQARKQYQAPADGCLRSNGCRHRLRDRDDQRKHIRRVSCREAAGGSIRKLAIFR